MAEATANNVVVHEIFSIDPAEGTFVSQAALERLSSTRTPQSPVALIEIPDRPLTPGRSVLVAWEIADPGNLGAMIRTAAAFGLDFMSSPGSADMWAPKVLRGAAGAHFHTGLGQADFDGFTMVGSVLEGGIKPACLPDGPLAVLIGSEAHGLPAELLDAASVKVTIPMSVGVESLNAAAAAAILCYEVARRRGSGDESSSGARSS